MKLIYPSSNRCRLLISLLFSSFAALSLAAEEPVPVPDLKDYEASVANHLRDIRTAFNRDLGKIDDPALRAQAYGSLGMQYHAHEQGPAAAVAYSNAIALDSQDPRWPYLLAYYLDQKGDDELAAKHYLQTLALRDDYVPAVLRLAHAQYRMQDYSVAKQNFTRALTMRPGSASAITGLADLAAAQGKARIAVDHYRQALEAAPYADALHYRLGQQYRKLAEIENARTHLEQAGKTEPEIEDALVLSLSGLSQSALDWLRRGQAALKAGNADLALDAFEIAVSVNPDDPAARISVGWAWQQKGDDAKALENYQKARRLDPDRVEPYQYSGALLEGLGQWEDARAMYRAALKLTPGHAQTRLALARIKFRLGDFAGARRSFASLLGEFPDSVGLSLSLAGSRLALGECTSALSKLRLLDSTHPNSAAIMQMLIRASATCKGLTIADKKKAVDMAQRLYDARPDLESAEALAMAMAAVGKFDEAVDFQGQAMFEAVKQNQTARLEKMRGVLAGYEGKRPASKAWAATGFVAMPDIDLAQGQ